jgi:hypothetical protein
VAIALGALVGRAISIIVSARDGRSSPPSATSFEPIGLTAGPTDLRAGDLRAGDVLLETANRGNRRSPAVNASTFRYAARPVRALLPSWSSGASLPIRLAAMPVSLLLVKARSHA